MTTRANPGSAREEGLAALGAGDRAEEAVLGAMIRFNAAIAEVATLIEASDFRSDANQRIYSAIIEQHDGGRRPVDMVSLAELLHRKGWLEDIGGAVRIYDLYDAALTGANATHHAAIVRDRSLVRGLEHAAHGILGACSPQSAAASDLLEQAEQSVLALGERKAERGAALLALLLDEHEKEIERRAASGDAARVVPGIPSLGKIVPGFFPGELVIVAGRPSVGKTSVALALARMAAQSGTATLFCSMEMSSMQLMDRLVAAEGDIDAQRLRLGKLDNRDYEAIVDAGRVLRGLPLWLDDVPAQPARRVAATARRLKARHGLGMVVVDYLGLMKPEDAKRPRHEQVGQMAAAMKALAKELSIPVVLLGQLNREIEHRGGDTTPRLADLRESGDIEAHADTVILLHRPDLERDELLLVVGKQRSGPVGKVSVRFVRSRMRFEAIGLPGVSASEIPDTPIGGPFA